MAPEILAGEKHTKAVDIWALGVMTYEFLAGVPPFNSETIVEIFEKIQKNQISFPPEYFSEEAVDFIKKLMNPIPTQRMGMDGWDEAKSHPFLSSVEWDKMLKMAGPFFPLYELRMKNKQQPTNAETEFFPKGVTCDAEIQDIMADINSQVIFLLLLCSHLLMITQSFRVYHMHH